MIYKKGKGWHWKGERLISSWWHTHWHTDRHRQSHLWTSRAIAEGGMVVRHIDIAEGGEQTNQNQNNHLINI